LFIFHNSNMKISLCIALLGLVALSVGTKVNYDGYTVLRITPQTEEERQVLLDLDKNNPGLVFWKHVRAVGLPVDIMVPPHLQAMMEEFTGQGIMSHTMVSDVQTLINEEALGVQGEVSPMMDWTSYHSVASIQAYLEEVRAAHPAVATTFSYGTSFEGRDLRCIRLNRGGTRKPLIFLDSGIHAREWITNPVALWAIRELVEGASTNYLNTFNFVICPAINPDGYEYSRASDRMWRKTRSNLAGGTCRGADPNRNFPFDWGTGGSSTNPCSDTYMGVRAASEPEVSALVDLLGSISNDMVSYVSLHSYSQLILISYGSNRGRVPDHNRHMTVGNQVATAIRGHFGLTFTPGNIVDLLYVASGGSGDHAKGTFNPDLAYTFELRDTGAYGFILPPAQITPSCQEWMSGFHVILDNVSRTLPSP